MKQKKAVFREIRSFQFEVQALFKRENISGTFYFNYKKNIGCCFRVTCSFAIHLTYSCSKSILETVAEVEKYVQN